MLVKVSQWHNEDFKGEFRGWDQRGFPVSLVTLPGCKDSSDLVAHVVHSRAHILYFYTGSVVTGEREKGFWNSFSVHVASLSQALFLTYMM